MVTPNLNGFRGTRRMKVCDASAPQISHYAETDEIKMSKVSFTDSMFLILGLAASDPHDMYLTVIVNIYFSYLLNPPMRSAHPRQIPPHMLQINLIERICFTDRCFE